MIEIITAAGFALAWFAFRYDREQRRTDALNAAQGALNAVHRGMAKGLESGEIPGWGSFYFEQSYDVKTATARAKKTYELVTNRGLDYVIVVPTEPLAQLATTTPHPGLIDEKTVTIANIALWRVGAFNRLVQNLGDFLNAHAVEIVSKETDPDRRHDLANAASSLSLFVHSDGIGAANDIYPDGSLGWYRALVYQLVANINAIEAEQRSFRWRWLREWQYVLVDVLALAGLISVVVTVAS